ncbi:type II toxin-antitoxin system CcdA family antitoxin [Hyphomicrobium sp. DY-1]|uniref:type II toxin-antitoxin system CcdA family antitoxin n=1 Tax=Hyphomicrobium sp. DY-1 TaxID=3075650 RepID=UPI0039C25C8F
MNAPDHRSPVIIDTSEDLLRPAKHIHLDTTPAAEDGIRTAQSEKWLQDNKEAINAYNRDIRKNGIAIPPLWARPCPHGTLRNLPQPPRPRALPCRHSIQPSRTPHHTRRHPA